MFSFFKKKDKNEPVVVIKPTEEFDDVMPIADYFHNETGVTFDRQESILKNKVVSFCRRREIYSFSNLLERVKSDSQLKQELIDHLTTNETFFYREVKQIEQLTKLVKEKNSSVDILCAPSATGEEPYSIAISLLEAGVAPSKISILGIDINSDAISKAKVAQYGERNVRNLSSDILNNYFVKEDDKYALKDSVKSLVSFKIINIFDESFRNLGKFDFIFSRNMLIYFNKETKLKAKGILESMRKTDEYDVFFGHADLY
ncbi:protein-glutamate O-methyltransferase CheR [Sulfurimonas sp.]|uniref:CheR family methyltransferase n=1 Tax=Sulfurimonas sp. TaxID=2022749 RepID=UPI00356A2937